MLTRAALLASSSMTAHDVLLVVVVVVVRVVGRAMITAHIRMGVRKGETEEGLKHAAQPDGEGRGGRREERESETHTLVRSAPEPHGDDDDDDTDDDYGTARSHTRTIAGAIARIDDLGGPTTTAALPRRDSGWTRDDGEEERWLSGVKRHSEEVASARSRT